MPFNGLNWIPKNRSLEPTEDTLPESQMSEISAVYHINGKKEN